MSKINVLHIVGDMSQGGVQSFLMNVLRNGDSSRLKFTFLCYGDDFFVHEAEILRLGGRIVRISKPTKNLLRHVLQLFSVLRKYRPDIIHTHVYLSSFVPLGCAFFSSINVRVAHSHSTRSEKGVSRTRAAYGALAKYLIGLFSTSRVACGDTAGRALFNDHAFTVINNGIVLKNFSYREPDRAAIRREFNISDSEDMILHVGRFVEVKNHQFLVRVFESYLDTYRNAKLVLVGDGPLKSEIAQLCDKLSISDSVIFTGDRTSDVNHFYSAADLFILSSVSEGFPLTLIEAQTNGLSSILSSGVPREAAVIDGMNHFLSLDDTVNSWVGAMHRLIRHRILGGEALMKTARFDNEDTAVDLQELYLGLVEAV